VVSFYYSSELSKDTQVDKEQDKGPNNKLTQAKACGYQIIFNALVAATFRLRKMKILIISSCSSNKILS
jgi:hypothetical protein